MTRVKNSPVKRARHKKVLARTSGFRMTKNRLWKVAHEAYLHALDYSFQGRKDRKSDFRALWILRLNAALRAIDPALTYSRFIPLLKTKQITLNRKVLADIATSDPETFAKIVEKVR
ncbi:MAG: LSU ribosomal protein l20p, large subunit ribosomal protein L20 [Microgenomates group bacterium GW2011_GWC1_46_16]|uniref:Large ribosomal subunit protein bL20 n=2 Tax=Candidatus Collieribacteriota TaxID=1752725 RepID=A0A1F5FZD7_9BACT|nr:MAG: 50S ribosomal protein L20 [Microgenomates group bacterium GW2011_GWF1_46_12]KKU26381.1 MAG: LSU ribosomal protein l20p, large subunit ribosomal protein L20 [Microgenomates group bacterium GW2011_GWC1_46_16]KKU27789.1 MAG: 50S ribosomal protein L20 [Microgenomates group bacterium GW2011_GWF2_46_18]KKU43098.1 MAG: 50S ribosomal protein L20 [Microgenomates group bacterium GW2011_GWA1_46_7]KKU45421.1 MAG: 50S ribosomal protein L20 [Microgenomates group bacterium GW2011_GWB1_46_7]KKU61325.1